MAKLSISDTARACGVARSTLQRAVQAGRLSLHPDHTVDTAELLRAGYTLHAARLPQDAAALQDTAPRGSSVPHDAAGHVSRDTALLRREMALLERERDLLRAALDAAAAREQTALEREAWLRHQLEQALTQNQRLLDMPRPAPPEPAPPAVPPRPPGPPPAEDYRGSMRARVLAALAGFPQGRTLGALEDAVGASRPLTNVLTGMYRDGLLVRVARGRYALPKGER